MKLRFGKEASKDALLLLGSDGGARLLGFLTSALLARVLGADVFGLTVLGVAVLNWGTSLGDLGTQTLGIREFAKPRDARSFSFADFVSLRGLLALAALAIMEAGIFAFVDDPTTRLVAALYAPAIVPMWLQIEWYFQGLGRYGALALVRTLFAAGFLAGVALFVRSPQDVVAVPLCFFGALLLASTVAMIAARSTQREADAGRADVFGSRVERWREMIRRATPIGQGAIFAGIPLLLPPLAIAWFHSEENPAEVGLFGAALRLATLLLILDRAFVALFLPRLTRMRATHPERTRSFLRSTFLAVAIGGSAVSLIVTLAAAPLLSLVYGSEYADAAPALAILSWFVTATLLVSFFAYALIATGVENAYFRASLVSGVLAAIVIVVLSRTAGATGGAIGMLIGETMMAAIMYAQYRKHRVGRRV